MKGVTEKIVGNKTVAICMAIVFVVFAAPIAADATSTEEKLKQAQEERENMKEQRDQVIWQKEDLEDKNTELKGALDVLNADLNEILVNLDQLEQDIIDQDAAIVLAEEELEEASRIRAEQYEAMKIRVQFMYESRDYILLETLFASANFSEFLNRNDYIEQLTAYDKQKLEEYMEIEADVTLKKEALIVEREELAAIKAEVQKEQDRIDELRTQTSNTIYYTEAEISEAEQRMLAYEEELKRQDEEIAQLNKILEEERRLSQLAAQAKWRDISDVSFAEGDRYLLANLIYCEAGNQPFEGQVAVGAVVINRVRSPVFPDTVVAVIYQNRQFSPVASGRLELALLENRATPACYQAADEAMAGVTTVEDCLFFRTPIEGINVRFPIGGHIFY